MIVSPYLRRVNDSLVKYACPILVLTEERMRQPLKALKIAMESRRIIVYSVMGSPNEQLHVGWFSCASSFLSTA